MGTGSKPPTSRRVRRWALLLAIAGIGLELTPGIAADRRLHGRGTIYDREHRVLAANRVKAEVRLDPGKIANELAREIRSVQRGQSAAESAARAAVAQRYLDRVNAVIGRRGIVDPDRLERDHAKDPSAPLVLVDNLTIEEVAQLEASAKSDALEVIRSAERVYPYHTAAAHVLGRVRRVRGPIGGELLRNGNDEGFSGVSGIEKQHDTILQGSGTAEAGDVVLSLDINLQIVAERELSNASRGSRSAAVVIRVDSGEILVLASRPGYDVNAVSPALSLPAKQQIDADGAWFNRATQGLYPPGSTFKIFTLMAGLRAGTLHVDDTLNCSGSLLVGERRFPCHNSEGHGRISLRAALAHSCNVFAYQVGLAAGADALAAEARRFHLDEPTGIDLPGETVRMLVADPAWKRSNGHGPWTAGDTANFSVGQGYLRCSPLQSACAMASLARRETLTVPTLLHVPERHATGSRAPEPLDLPDRSYDAVIRGLEDVVLTGIGRNAQVPGVRLAGKTGTAQVRRHDGTLNVAWFLAFAPVERPEIAMAVAVEGDVVGEEYSGAEHAAPIAREIVAAYFENGEAAKRGSQTPPD